MIGHIQVCNEATRLTKLEFDHFWIDGELPKTRSHGPGSIVMTDSGLRFIGVTGRQRNRTTEKYLDFRTGLMTDSEDIAYAVPQARATWMLGNRVQVAVANAGT